MQDLKETITTTSNEGLTLNIDVSLQYRLAPQQADEIYQNIGEDASEIIISRFRSIVRETTANLQESIERKLAAEQESQQAQFELEKARQDAEKQRIEARGRADAQRLLAQELTEELLRLKAIEATSELARSENTKVVVIGGRETRLPIVLQRTPEN